MITDEERREVARRLRDSAEERMAAKGRGNGNSWSWLYRSVFGHYMWTEKGAKGRYVEVAHRLADLIEPDEPQVKRELKYRSRCDELGAEMKRQRDALLKLADEMFEDATGLAFISQLEENEELQDLQSTMAKALMDYARRIREALGVER